MTGSKDVRPALDRTLVSERAVARVDRFLAEELPGCSRRRARELCERGRVMRNGSPARAGDTVSPGDTVAVHGPIEPVAARAELAGGIEPLVLFEDARVIIVDKPRGMPSVRLRDEDPPTVADLLVAYETGCAEASPDRREGGLIHRLDTSTSGALIAAKSRTWWHELRALLLAGTIDKSYLALVEGSVEAEREVIRLPLAAKRNTRTVEVTVESGESALAAAAGSAATLPATTEITVVRRLTSSTIVRAVAPTARRHQVRAHLAAVGHPLVGDLLYGGVRDLASVYRRETGDEEGAAELTDGFLLHAERVAFSLGGDIVDCRPPSRYFVALCAGNDRGAPYGA